MTAAAAKPEKSRYRRRMHRSLCRARARAGRTLSAWTARFGLTSALTGLLLGCGDPLPSSQRIASTRVLAVRSEVILPLLPEPDPSAAPRCEALPFETVRLTPFVVDTDGPFSPAELDPIWLACNLGPVDGLFACLKGAFPTELALIPECPPVSFDSIDPESGSLPESPSPCRIPADATPDDGAQDLTVPLASTLLFGGDIELTMIGRSGDAPSAAECADRLLGGDSVLPVDCIYVVQRLSVGPIERLLALLVSFGAELPAGLEPPDPEAIPDGDRNPRITDFVVTIIQPDGTTRELGPLDRGATVEAQLGDLLEIRTNAPAADLQPYLVPVNQGAGGYEERTETYRARWFRTWGVLLSGSSDDPESTNSWELLRGDQDESERPPDDRATLFYVLRDSRQGVDWWWIHVTVAPEG